MLREGGLFASWVLEVVQAGPFVDRHVTMVWGSSAGIRKESKCEIRFPPHVTSLPSSGQKSGWMGPSIWQAVASAVSTWR